MVATIFVAAASVAVFMLLFWLSGIAPTAMRAIATARGAVEKMRRPDLDDLARERAVRRAAIELLAAAAWLTIGALLSLLAAVAPILAADWAGVVPRAATLDFMERWDVILVVTVVVTLIWLTFRARSG